jgi:Nif-specific regulatory protein
VGAGSGGHADADDDLGHAVAVDDKPDGERDRLIWAMEKCGWVQAKAARLLNITPRQMGYALQKYDIEVRKF